MQKRILFLLVALLAASVTWSRQPLTPLKVELVTRAISKTPVLTAYDRGIYKKYGLDVKLWLPPGEFPGAMEMEPNGQSRHQRGWWRADGDCHPR